MMFMDKDDVNNTADENSSIFSC